MGGSLTLTGPLKKRFGKPPKKKKGLFLGLLTIGFPLIRALGRAEQFLGTN